MKNNIQKGKYGEELAYKYLISKGYKVLDRNYNTKVGEIDIIACKDNIVAFIEVKSRTSINYGYPYEAVNWNKRSRIIKASKIYMKHKNIKEYQIRYDIIEVYLQNPVRINHLENVFFN